MLLVAFVWSITANFDKIGVTNSNPIFWAISMNIFVMFILFPVIYLKSRKQARKIPRNIKALLPVGLFGALLLIFQMTAITMTLVAYVISVKRTSAIMGVIFGALIFREKNIKGRLAGAIIMVLGVLLITLS